MLPPSPILDPVARNEARVFRVLGWSLLIFTFFAFAQKLVVVPERIERYTPLVRVHGAAMLAWLALFTLQAELASRGAMRTHKSLGVLSAPLVAVAIWTGFHTTRAFSGEMDMIEVFLSNLVHLSALGLFWTAGVIAALAHRIEVHRRMMLFAALAVLSPPISRVTQTIGLPNGAAAAAHAGLVITLPLVFDVATRGRPHRATAFALALVAALSMTAAAMGLLPPLHRMVSDYLGIAS